MTDKTYKTYNVEAKGTIKLCMESQVLGDLYMMATLWRSHLFDQNQIDLA